MGPASTQTHDVYVLTHDRPSLLPRTLASLTREARSLAPPPSGLYVISSGERPRDMPGDVVLLHRPDLAGAAAKRGFALTYSAATWVSFLDDDCEVALGSFQALWDAVGACPDGGRVGAVYPRLRFAGPATLAFEAALASGLTAGMGWLFGRDGGFRWGPSAWVMVRREAALAVGAFSPQTFTVPAGGEDVDMGRRLELHAWGRLPCDDATVHHTRSTWNSVPANVRRARSYGWAEGELLRLHPGDGIAAGPGQPTLGRRILARLRGGPDRRGSGGAGRRMIMTGMALTFNLAYRLGRVEHAVQHRDLSELTRRYDWAGELAGRDGRRCP